MKIVANPIYPLSLQGKNATGTFFEVQNFDDRHYLIDGKKVSTKYFKNQRIIHTTEELNTKKFMRGESCPYCKSGDKQVKFCKRSGDYICYDCIEKDGNFSLCSHCEYIDHCQNFNGYSLCDRCFEGIPNCKKCGEKYNYHHHGRISIDGGRDTSVRCKNCTKNCKVCGLECGDEFCMQHNLSNANRSDCVNLSPRAIGIEVEIINQLRNKPSRWRYASDSSLNEGGIEYYSPPYIGDSDMMMDLEQFETEVEKSCSYTDNSCGLHIHIDTRDLSAEEIFRLYHVCKSIEDWIYSVVTPARRSSKYSEPLDFEESDTLEKTIYGNYVLDTTLIKRDKYHIPRYKWVNFHSHFFRGSTEFRCHHGIISAEKIYYWASLCQKIVDYVKICNNIPKNGIEILEKTNSKKVLIGYFKRRMEVMQ